MVKYLTAIFAVLLMTTPTVAKISKRIVTKEPYFIFGQIEKIKNKKIYFVTENKKFQLKYQQTYLANSLVLKKKRNKKMQLKLRVEPSFIVSTTLLPTKKKGRR